MLYLVATPIGNLDDFTMRGIATLRDSDYILCEDTRRSKQLLHRYEIRTPLKSFYKYNEASKEDSIIHDLKQSKSISLISDAGTPGISDPGERLIKRCIQEKIPVIAIPGPCSLIQALVCSGLQISPFQFIGFLPKKENEKQRILTKCLAYPGTTIFFETPQRLLKTLQTLAQIQPEAKLVVARELTKKFEEHIRGTSNEVCLYFSEKPPKGELICLIEGGHELSTQQLSIQEHVASIQQEKSITQKEAIKEVAAIRKIPKRTIYNLIIKNEK